MKTLIGILVAVTLLLVPTRGPAQSTVPWSAIDMGFVVSSSSTTILKSVVGQGFVGPMQGATSIVESGFLADTLFRTTTSVAERGGIPKEYALQQNYPNPFNPATVVSFQLPVASHVNLVVYDMLGREVSVLVNERKSAGSYEVKFDASGLASGVYLYRIQAGDFAQSKKLVILK